MENKSSETIILGSSIIKTNTNMKLSPAERFSSRVDAYLKYRPTYPPEIIEYLKSETLLSSEHIVADIGSGTGFLSKIFLDNGNTVYGIEPNNPMREAGEKWLSEYKNFISRTGRAENTFLENNSVDFITAGQSFHWFEPEATKKEFLRIARDGAKLVLVWNRRDIHKDPMQIGYEDILRKMIPEYRKVDHKNISDEKIQEFAEPFILHYKSFNHYQLCDFESLIGRLLSASYCPDETSAIFKNIKEKLFDLFKVNAVGGKVKFNYSAMVYLANLKQ
jgi:SAM-dependent methyltransferase